MAPLACALVMAVSNKSGVQPARKNHAGREPRTAATTAATSSSTAPRISSGLSRICATSISSGTWLRRSSTSWVMPTAIAITGTRNSGA